MKRLILLINTNHQQQSNKGSRVVHPHRHKNIIPEPDNYPFDWIEGKFKEEEILDEFRVFYVDDGLGDVGGEEDSAVCEDSPLGEFGDGEILGLFEAVDHEDEEDVQEKEGDEAVVGDEGEGGPF